MRRNRYASCLVSLGLAALFLVAFTPEARAVTVSVVPADTTVLCGDTLTVRIVTDAVSDLKAYQLVFGFDPVVLQYIGVEAGDLLTASPGYTMQELPDVTAPVDSVWLDCAVLVGSTDGPGVLAYLRFVAMETGVSPIQCLQVDFRDSWNVQTLPACEGGIVRVPHCPVLTLTRTWGGVKTIYR